MYSSIQNRKNREIRINRRPPAGTVRSREPPVRRKASGIPQAKQKRMTPLAHFLMKLSVTAIVCVIIFTFVAGVRIQQGNRMYPFLMDGDLLITYKLGQYMEGDVVLYRNPETGEKEVSRIAATGQNEILITEEGQLLINRFAPDDQVFYPTQPLKGSEIRYPFRMAEGECFLLDDFRTQGEDSRLFGAVSEDDLLGKVVYVFRRREI